jgi:hypothetical protein
MECQSFKNGYAVNEFIRKYFNDCVYSPTDAVSFCLGLIGMAACSLALFPQYVTNYKLKSVEGISFGLILFWTAGDVSSFLGTILTSQLVTQKITGFIFALMDGALMIQYLYYHFLYPKPQRTDELVCLLPESGDDQTDATWINNGKTDVNDQHIHGEAFYGSFSGSDSQSALLIETEQELRDDLDVEHRNNVSAAAFMVHLLISPVAAQSFSESEKEIGYLMAWISSTFYLISR